MLKLIPTHPQLNCGSPLFSLSLSVSCLGLMASSSLVLAQQPPGFLAPVSNPSQSLQGSSPPMQEAPYSLGVGDRIQLEIFNVPEYSKEYQVLIDGTINLPLIGGVSVEGLTLQQAADTVTRLYAPLLTDPIITMNLVGIRPLKIAIAGEVTRPGAYTINPTTGPSTSSGATGVQYPTLTQALELAKGITSAGNLRQIQVRRPQRFGPEQVMTLNLWEFFATGDQNQNLTLRDGDTIFVPTISEIDTLELRSRANANFSADLKIPVSIAVVGEVNRPGPYILSINTQIPQDQGQRLASIPTITQAIRAAGGITLEANLRQVEVHRRRPGGSEQIFTANLWNLLQTGDLREDLPLQEGDSIVVPKADNIDLSESAEMAVANFAPNTIKIYVVGEVVRSGIVEVPPNTSLHQALLAAGGFNQQRAKKDAVELIRQNPNGTVSLQTIDVDFSQGLNPDNNPTLRQNDVIVIARSGLTRFTENLTAILAPFNQIVGIFNNLQTIGDFFNVEDSIIQNSDRTQEILDRLRRAGVTNPNP